MINDNEIICFLESSRDNSVALLSELVKVPSDNPPGDCASHAESTAALLTGLGFEVEAYAVPEALCQASGMISATNLIVRKRFGDGPVIALNAHGDVVAPGAGWSHDPFAAEIVDGWLYGRGAAVSKSDIATYAFALKALEATQRPLAGTVELHITYDEEVGGEIGPKWLLDQGLSAPDYAICAGFSYAVVVAHNGCLHVEVVVSGRSAHAAKPETGHDALEAANDIMSALYAHRCELGTLVSETPGIGSPNLNIGLIEGGINTNVVPDRVSFRIDRRMIPEENAKSVETTLRDIVSDAVSGKDGISVDVERIMLAAPFKPVGDTERLLKPLIRHASAVFGEDIAGVGVPLYTDARHYSEAGIPTVLYGAGPRTIEEANAHRADERVRVDDLHKATKVVALALADILQA